MADIRINSLPSTATSFNTDDYIAIDGASAGTRKMLAATLPLTDVTLGGASGPSVKSTLSARAPRQGLVFDGTAGAAVSGPTLGTSNFTAAAWVNISSLPASAISGIISGAANSLSFGIGTTGAIDISKTAVANVGTSTGTIIAGKQSFIVYSRSGTTGTFYINGVASGTVTDSQDYSVAQTLVGSAVTSSLYVFPGTIVPLIFNRALSAAEVVALYESGAPSGADYNSASNTGVITGQNNTFNGGIGNWTSGGTGTVAAGTNVMNCTAGSTADNLAGYLTFVNAGYNPKGYYVRVTADITNNSGTVRIGVGRLVLTQIGSLAGNGTFDATAFIPATTDADAFWICGATSSQTFTVDNFQVFRLGLLLAPDAAQAGGGLVWYDTSGNAANITLPASGVSWNVPTSGRWGGSLTVAAGGNASLKFAGASNVGTLSFLDGAGTAAQTAVVESYSFQVKTNGTSALTIGATQDATFTGYVLNRVNAKGIYTGTSDNCGFTWTGTNGEFSTVSGSLILKSAGTTALTLDSSQNATFAGRVTTSGKLSVGTTDAYGQSNVYASGASLPALNLRAVGNTNEAAAYIYGEKYGLAIGINSTSTEYAFSVKSGVATASPGFTGGTTLFSILGTGAATFTGAVAIGNTVQTAVAVASTHKVTISIGGSTYYLLATNV